MELKGSAITYDALYFSAFLYASRGERNKIDPQLLKLRPEVVTDSDVAYGEGGVYALLGEKGQALTWLRRAVQLGNHNYPWFQRDKNYDSYAVTRNTSASWRRPAAIGSTAESCSGQDSKAVGLSPLRSTPSTGRPRKWCWPGRSLYSDAVEPNLQS